MFLRLLAVRCVKVCIRGCVSLPFLEYVIEARVYESRDNVSLPPLPVTGRNTTIGERCFFVESIKVCIYIYRDN